MQSQINERLKKIISVQLHIPLEQIDDNAKIHAQLGLDSLDVVNLMSAIGIEFNIILKEKDVIHVETLQQLSAVVLREITDKQRV